MTEENAFLFVGMSMIAMCFAWGIRGLVIGGEKGALLPGAYIEILCVWYPGSEMLMANVFLFAAAGAMGFAFGAMEPYGQTMQMVLKHSPGIHRPLRGYLALAFKGSLWGGLGAGILGLSFSALSGEVYRWTDILIFCAQIPLAQEVGYRLFNTPYDPQKGIRPRICFSTDSREEWGRNLVVVTELILMMLIRRDAFGLILLLGGALSGAAGWILGIFLYDKEAHPLKNGRYLFGKLEKLGIISGWKIMEFTQGAVNGLGISLAFCVGWPLIADKFTDGAALWRILPDTLDRVLSWTACALIVLSIFLFIIPYRKNGNKITRAFGEVDMHVVEVTERPLYNVIPLALVLLGSTTMARIMCFFVIYYVLAQHDGLERFCDFKHLRLLRIGMILIGALILVGEILTGYTLWQTWLLYGIAYLAFDFVYNFRPKTVRQNRAKSRTFGRFVLTFGEIVTTHPFFLLLLAALLVFGAVHLR
ncbi:MAG: hypothetical protein IJL69_04935 [Oscillospiraceae bacterium]|nr:hypothetical protein [Oscillospiraceae bacterium]